MKRTNYRLMFTLMCCFGILGFANAQFDDIYFNPGDADEIYAQIDLEKYSDESYESKSVKPDDYDYYYASRIKRFDNPYYGFDFYSPVYVDPAYYNPAYSNFYRPGSSIYYGAGTIVSTTSYGYQSYATPSWGYGASSSYGGYGGYNSGYGGFGSTGSYNGYGASYGGGYGGGFAGGYNAYCPPSVGGIYNNPSTGVFQPGITSTPNPNTRSGSAVGSTPIYGPRGSGNGSVTTSPRNNTTRPGTSGTAPDRPLVASTPTTGTPTSSSPRAGQKTYPVATEPRSGSYAGPRTSRPVYTAPAQSASSLGKTNSVRNRFSSSSTRPSRPSANSYSPSSRSFSGSRTATRNSLNRSSSSSSFRSSSSGTSRSFSSPRSSGSSSSRSSGASRSGGSPRK